MRAFRQMLQMRPLPLEISCTRKHEEPEAGEELSLQGGTGDPPSSSWD
eukprot:CAMPEP_0179145580 /NCGR_PEP_ID=MMETSP0796-20121207/70249_1 /TAXON_ID=73915 /ORGANISM="Pyrodinium bahamense, Strain pbaha01" /LENGTH=47 /DNA_ID= /DNA_START= /DNA_END= /DNA_ORIENTATION=